MSWKGELVINIVCNPFEAELEQFAPFLLATPNPFIFSWSDGYLFFFRYDSELYFDMNKKIAGYITVIYQLQYIKTKYFKFIKLNANTGGIEFTNTMEGGSDYLFYPISDELDEIIVEILKKVKECEHAIKGKY